MPNYQNGKIYAIRTYKSDEFYIGSTTIPLSKRLWQHKSDYNVWKNGKKHYITSFKIIENEDAYIELLEECPCDNKMLLQKREGELIRANNCVNKRIERRTTKEWYQDNKEKILENGKKWYQDNKEIKLENGKKWYEKNKENRLEQLKEYRNNNKDKIKEYMSNKIQCECGLILSKGCLARHKKTKKHQFYQSIYDFIYE